MKIKLRLELRFRPLAYPNCELSEKLLQFRGYTIKPSSFTKKSINILKDIGFEIEYSGDPLLIKYFESK